MLDINNAKNYYYNCDNCVERYLKEMQKKSFPCFKMNEIKHKTFSLNEIMQKNSSQGN